MAEEEHRCQAPRLCVNNCGFFGSPATQNMCSKCYRDLQLKNDAKLALNQTLTPPSVSPSSPSSSSSSSVAAAASSSASVSLSLSLSVSSAAIDVPEVNGKQTAVDAKAEKEVRPTPNRCMTCRKRVGLTGFKCRCGMVFCGSHRYPEQHSCGFDFKSLGKEQIAKANPVIKAQKLDKI